MAQLAEPFATLSGGELLALRADVYKIADTLLRNSGVEDYTPYDVVTLATWLTASGGIGDDDEDA